MSYGLSKRAEAHIRGLAAKHLHMQCFYQSVVKAEDRERGFEYWRGMQVIEYMVPEWLSREELYELCDVYLKARFFGSGTHRAMEAEETARANGIEVEHA